MRQILQSIIHQHILSFGTAKQLMIDISERRYAPNEVAALLSLIQQRGVHSSELAGFRQALLDQAVSIDLDIPEAIDIVGTGGDGKNTFNISTAAAFVVAAAGFPVIKHGNYSASSVSGSSHIFEQLGFELTADRSTLMQYLQQLNICFLHAPCFHPSMKEVAPIRRELNIPTIFNILGPLINPAGVKNLCLGVANLKTLRLYRQVLQGTSTRYTMVHNLDGYDEISLTDQVKVDHYLTGDTTYSPHHFGTTRIEPQEIYGGDSTEAAFQLFLNILSGNGTQAQNQVVMANAAIAIRLVKPELSLTQAKQLAKESLLGLSAYELIKQIRS